MQEYIENGAEMGLLIDPVLPGFTLDLRETWEDFTPPHLPRLVRPAGEPPQISPPIAFAQQVG